MKYLIPLVVIFFLACNSPQSDTKPVAFLQSLKMQGKGFTVVDQNGDTLIIIGKDTTVKYSYPIYTPHDTTVSYTYSVYDTTWRRKGNIQPPIPPDTSHPTPPDGYKQIYFNGYNSTADINSNQKPSGHSLSDFISTTNFKTGPGSFYSRTFGQSTSSGIRCEEQYTNAQQNPTEGAVEQDIMFPSFKGTGFFSGVMQWHPNNNNSALIWGEVGNGYLQVIRSLNGTNNYQQNFPQGKLTPISGQWYHWRWEFKWSTGSDGYMRLYINNNPSPYYEWKGVTQDGNGKPYIKVGQNNGSSSIGQDIYIDNLYIYQKGN